MFNRASSLVTSARRSSSTDGHGDELQPDLPKLPVPELEKTLQRYLEAVHPILSPTQYERVEGLVQEFSEKEGPILQHNLIERQIKMQNWAYEWWMKDMYMNNPLCLPINSNPGGVWPPQHFQSVEDQINFAATFVSFMLDFKDVLDRRELPVEKAVTREPGQPLCMAQYYRLFTSYRVPSIPWDFRRDTSTLDPDHIIVAYRKHFFTCPIRTPVARLTIPQLVSQLSSIVSSEQSNNETPLGLLTTGKRPIWADQRMRLLGDELNKQSMEEIETCCFILCLDDPLPPYFNSASNKVNGGRNDVGHWINGRDETSMLHQMLHGGGSIFNTGNRWFDKTLQFIVSSDGAVGICYEHSQAEGIGILNLVDEFYGKQRKEGKYEKVETEQDGAQETILEEIPKPIKLVWNVPPDMNGVVREASQEIDGLIEDLDLAVYRFQGYGKDFIKKCKVSPDVYIQLALQLTYYTVHGKMVATYESGSTRRYKLGRVDCIRSTTMEVLDWVQGMLEMDENKSEELSKKFHLAVDKQTGIMVENILGEGIDIHLMGLRAVAAELGMDDPKLFADETFRIANHFALSTSQLPTKEDQFMGYGAVVPDGYGASYNPQNGSIIFCLSSFRSCPTTSTTKFSAALEQSLKMMKKVLG